MNFAIPCETYVRLAGILHKFPKNVNDDERKVLNCIRLEVKRNAMIAIASNRRIAAVEHCGETGEPDGVAHIVIDKALLNQCNTEKAFNSTLSVTVIPDLQMGSAKTTLGYNYPGNVCMFPASTPLDKWATWVADEPAKVSKGAMGWDLDDVEALNRSSPSGQIAFPEFIDANKPVILRDRNAPEWVGLFMSNKVDDNGNAYTVPPAELPTWFR